MGRPLPPAYFAGVCDGITCP